MIIGMAADELDLYSGVSFYVQVARIIEAEIRAGTWTVGSVVPSRTQLAQRFNVATETARHAMRYLAERGYLASVPGLGMVVTPADRWPEEA
jgi:DNA-binding GntR family transcriptional regulator